MSDDSKKVIQVYIDWADWAAYNKRCVDKKVTMSADLRKYIHNEIKAAPVTVQEPRGPPYDKPAPDIEGVQ